MKTTDHYVICVSNKGNELSVIKGKVYRVADPEPNDRSTDIRIVDESGEDYLYDRNWFMEMPVPRAVVEALEAA